MNQWWSWILTIVGVTGLYFVGRHSLWGWIIGIGVQFLWLIYSITTKQWGFVASAFAYGFINIKNYICWRSERKLIEKSSDGRFSRTTSK